MLGVLPLNFFIELHRAGKVEVAVLQQGAAGAAMASLIKL
jgi:hypothetical protein